jgi:acyl carrier protein
MGMSNKSMDQTIAGYLSRYISESILKQPNRKIMPDELLISSGLVDSFSLVDLALYIEDTFSVHIDDTELNSDTFDTIRQLAELITDRQI